MSVEEFHARRLAAYRAYYENMPLPTAAMPTATDMRLYTQRAFGDLVSFYTLDQRQYRSPQACWSKERKRQPVCDELQNPERTMLGAEQEAWLGRELANTHARWNVLVQGTVMSYIDEDPGPGEAFWGDAWNGYPAARRRLMNQLVDTRAANPIVLTGDVHAFIVSGLHREAGDLSTPIVATEIATTSVTSNGNSQRALDVWRATNPNLLVAEARYRGYTRIEVTRDLFPRRPHRARIGEAAGLRRERPSKIVIEAERHTPERADERGPRNKSVTRSPDNVGPQAARPRRRFARAIRRANNYSEDRSPMRSPDPLLVWLSFFVGLFGLVQNANAWWNDQWAFRKEITFDLSPAGADIPGSPTDVPVLIRLSLGNFGYFGDTLPSGADLHFVASDDKTPLEIAHRALRPAGADRLRVGARAASRRWRRDRQGIPLLRQQGSSGRRRAGRGRMTSISHSSTTSAPHPVSRRTRRPTRRSRRPSLRK